jgi:hypothetical protein
MFFIETFLEVSGWPVLYEAQRPTPPTQVLAGWDKLVTPLRRLSHATLRVAPRHLPLSRRRLVAILHYHPLRGGGRGQKLGTGGGVPLAHGNLLSGKLGEPSKAALVVDHGHILLPFSTFQRKKYIKLKK